MKAARLDQPDSVSTFIMPITIHSEEDIKRMRIAGRLAAEVLDFITPYVQAGITTGEIDRLCHDYMVQVQRTIPACLNYAPPGHAPYPKSLCTSVNDVACHGIPDGRVLCDGDIVNIDVTVIKDGYHGDTSRMYYVGTPSSAARRLCELARECMWCGIEQIKPGIFAGDIGHAVQQHAERHGASVVREFFGHGIGKQFHQEPWIPAFSMPGMLARIEPGMIITVEPIISEQGPAVERLADGWTWVSCDGGWSAQWEHTVLVTETGYEILTTSAGALPLADADVHTAAEFA